METGLGTRQFYFLSDSMRTRAIAYHVSPTVRFNASLIRASSRRNSLLCKERNTCAADSIKPCCFANITTDNVPVSGMDRLRAQRRAALSSRIATQSGLDKTAVSPLPKSYAKISDVGGGVSTISNRPRSKTCRAGSPSGPLNSSSLTACGMMAFCGKCASNSTCPTRPSAITGDELITHFSAMSDFTDDFICCVLERRNFEMVERVYKFRA